MHFVEKVSVSVMCVLFIAMTACMASAITITSNVDYDSYNNYGSYSDVYTKNIAPGSSFEYTFTAVDASGQVHWSISDQPSYTPELSSETGTTTTVRGVFPSGQSAILIQIIAEDDDDNFASYRLVLQNSTLAGEEGGGRVLENDNSVTQESESSSNTILEGNIVPVTSESVGQEVLETIAGDVKDLEAEDISFLTADDIGDTYAPTESMKQEASGKELEYIAQFQTITVQPDRYYLFEMDFPAKYIGMSAREVKLQIVNADTLKDSSVKSSQFLELMADRFFSGTELRTMSGKYADTIAGKMLVLLFSNTGGSFTMFALKTIASILTGGSSGCNAGAFAGSGLAGLFMALSVIALRKKFRR